MDYEQEDFTGGILGGIEGGSDYYGSNDKAEWIMVVLMVIAMIFVIVIMVYVVKFAKSSEKGCASLKEYNDPKAACNAVPAAAAFEGMNGVGTGGSVLRMVDQDNAHVQAVGERFLASKVVVAAADLAADSTGRYDGEDGYGRYRLGSARSDGARTKYYLIMKPNGQPATDAAGLVLYATDFMPTFPIGDLNSYSASAHLGLAGADPLLRNAYGQACSVSAVDPEDPWSWMNKVSSGDAEPGALPAGYVPAGEHLTARRGGYERMVPSNNVRKFEGMGKGYSAQSPNYNAGAMSWAGKGY